MDKVGEQLPAVAITAASLTLVFLGFLLASWEGYDTSGKAAVRAKYRTRAVVAYWGILSSLAAVLLGFVSVGSGHAYPWVDVLGCVCLAGWGALTITQARMSLRDIK